jgi:hypothetical protein
VNRELWQHNAGRIWIGDRWAFPKEVADHARDLATERDKANAEADRLAEELLVARGEVARLRKALREAEAGLEFAVAAIPSHGGGFVRSHAAALSIVRDALAPPAREGGAA